MATAFPPAPSYTLFGIVRDQVGQTLEVEGATLVLLKGTERMGRTPSTARSGMTRTTRLKIRIDANRPATQVYSEAAIASSGPFSLVVEMNGARFYPIEVAGTLTAGEGGETVRLDLNLGEDADGDGLPDVWEQWQFYQAGHLSAMRTAGISSLIDRDGDFDGDGRSNWLEYLAGTFAGDRTDFFEAEVKEKTATNVRFEFFAITGKTYTIERRTDAGTWTPRSLLRRRGPASVQRPPRPSRGYPLRRGVPPTTGAAHGTLPHRLSDDLQIPHSSSSRPPGVGRGPHGPVANHHLQL